METLFDAIDCTPIIDHHAHNLLLLDEITTRQLMTITTEAGDGPLKDTPSSLSHIRAVKQLSEVLGCASNWKSVEETIAKKRREPNDAWARRCFEGIETVLIDDGLDENTVHPWDWHHRLTRSECKRIVRIEKVAESILGRSLQAIPQSGDHEIDSMDVFETWETTFIATIKKAIRDPDVVGFKSVICYRTGLAIRGFSSDNTRLKAAMDRMLTSDSIRLDDTDLSPYFVHLTAQLISESKGHRKPFQFHTGLGDNDITLSLASPSHMQRFIKTYPNVPIVLLHASYPFTKEAGYLASVYENVFFDIGEVFPMVSQDGQESVLRESLELCPSEKLCWSTDGHWFPETYLLAVIQVREGMKKVLGDNVTRRSLEIPQAVKIVQDVLFNTSNRLYDLGLTLKSLEPLQQSTLSPKGPKIMKLDILVQFLAQNPSVKFLRLQWLDYVTTLRLRIIPIKLALDMFNKQKSIGITKAGLGLIHRDVMVPTFNPVGEYQLIPCFEGLRLGERDGYATVQGEFHEKSGAEVSICPRSALRRIIERAEKNDISFLVGFELEVVFMTVNVVDGAHVYGSNPVSHGHTWSNASALRSTRVMEVVEEILTKLERSKIDLQQFHPESAPGQYEFVTGPLPPLQAVDALIATQDIIYSVAEKHALKATFVPKPYEMACGTGAHVHISMSPEAKHPSFYAGILKHLPAIAAFTYSNISSYDRMQDSVWSGGRYVTWGTQNRETPLRKIEGSHWEMKCMDGLANKYLALAAILGAGLQGILDDQPLTHKDCTSDPALLDAEGRRRIGIEKQLPKDFPNALQRLDKDKDLRKILGDEVVDVYLAVKRAEMDMLDDLDDEERRDFLLERY